MPLPVGQIAVFTAIAVPYVVILKVLGLPFSHTLLWLYILPPGALAWVVTRPVLESKRLPELVVSQLRYVSEPRTWCRMAPPAEKDEIVITAPVWRPAGHFASPGGDDPSSPHERAGGRGAAWTEERATQERATREGGASEGGMGRRAGPRRRAGDTAAPAWPHQPG